MRRRPRGFQDGCQSHRRPEQPQFHQSHPRLQGRRRRIPRLVRGHLATHDDGSRVLGRCVRRHFTGFTSASGPPTGHFGPCCHEAEDASRARADHTDPVAGTTALTQKCCGIAPTLFIEESTAGAKAPPQTLRAGSTLTQGQRARGSSDPQHACRDRCEASCAAAGSQVPTARGQRARARSWSGVHDHGGARGRG